ncbi:NUDIX domain-containing protein [Streptomyces oryzae]|uniref:NUDIX domain-containing protein n=1 Tax=Streptomyces oryzae TaxID=1434886 RepID=A0ABS3X8Z1_9ACTN|nr:NUDIX domain-containing protein [Streptomyces oryzae]MBO8191854.1 NUDIX domain-containing protein [Streptomyces oryzae]
MTAHAAGPAPSGAGNGEPLVVVAAAIVQAGRLLVVSKQAAPENFYLPGGKTDPGEEPLDTLSRELDVELGGRPVEPDDRFGRRRVRAPWPGEAWMQWWQSQGRRRVSGRCRGLRRDRGVTSRELISAIAAGSSRHAVCAGQRERSKGTPVSKGQRGGGSSPPVQAGRTCRPLPCR